jgi:DNA topoisomerase IB
MRLRKSDCAGRGVTRRRAGRGFIYLDPEGQRIQDETLVDRIRNLAIPPAWKDVWICPQPNGHIQATGIDDAGRKQYLYHERWTTRQATQKFETMLLFASALPRLRRTVSRDLGRDEPDRDRVLAGAVRLLDLGQFRVGSEQYAEENSTFGVATILKSQVHLPGSGDEIEFDYPAKGSQDRHLTIRDSQVRTLSEILIRRRSGPEDFLVYKEGRKWVDVRSQDVNGYIQQYAGEDFSAKDFRTWHGTVTAAVSLARLGEPPSSARSREKAIRAAVEKVAEQLGNTAAVARESYIDSRILDRYRSGEVITAGYRSGRPSRNGLSVAERAVREMLDG